MTIRIVDKIEPIDRSFNYLGSYYSRENNSSFHDRLKVPDLGTNNDFKSLLNNEINKINSDELER